MKCLFLFFAIIFIINGCNYKEQLVTPDDVISNFTTTPATLLADGVSTIIIKAELPSGTIDSKRDVIFTTNTGTFEPSGKNTVTVPAQNIIGSNGEVKVVATVNFKGTVDISKATITTQVQRITRTDIIDLVKAYPETIKLVVDKIYYKPTLGTELVITTSLNRTVGFPSSGHAFTLTVTDSINRTIGNFRNKQLISGPDGKAINYFSIVPGAFKGTATVTATTTTLSGSATSDIATVFVFKP